MDNFGDRKKRNPIGWVFFWALLLVPTILGLLLLSVGASDSSLNDGELMQYLAFAVLGIACLTSLYCGIWLSWTWRYSMPKPALVILGLFLAAGIMGLNAVTFFLGCSAMAPLF